jgi:hypothetical protein
MRISGIYILVLSLNIFLYLGISTAQVSQKSAQKTLAGSNQLLSVASNPPVAVNDTFFLFTGCGRDTISGNILSNDYDSNGDEIALLYIVTPRIGKFYINEKGEFTFTIPKGYLGTIKLDYYISETSADKCKAGAEVVIYIKADYDCDNVPDDDDLDNDNDGILDTDEGNGDIDSDNDGIPDSFDIDSDNDGITDNQEWQQEGYFIAPKGEDINKNGWDDAYDNIDFFGGVYNSPVDSNNDGEPDFIDENSDDDEIPDCVEGYDINHDGAPEVSILYCDTDKDGLDDAYDTVSCWSKGCNPTGSNSPLPDLNKNGVRDWRETENYTPEEKEEKELIPELIFLYPNPATQRAYITIPNSNEQEEIKFLLFSSNGTLLLEKLIHSGQNIIDIDNFDSGVYFTQFHFNTRIQSDRLIIKN